MNQILSAEEMNRAITRISHEILEKNKGAERLVLIGIRTARPILTNRFQSQIGSIEGKKIPLGLLDITLYRDDLTEIGSQPNLPNT